MRARRLLALGALLSLLITGTAGLQASATDPVDLDPGFITDRAGVLSGGETSSSESRLQKLYDDSGANLFVVFVDHFTFPSDAGDWANQVFDDHNLGPHQYLRAIAVEGRSYYLAAHVDSELDDTELGALERAAQSSLSNENWTQAIDVVATALAAVLDSGTSVVPTSGPAPTQTSSPQPSGGSGTGLIWLFGMLAVVALVIWLIVRSAKKKGATSRPLVPGAADPYAAVSDKDLERQAGSALVQTDDAVTSSREELGFATAQFGDGATATFTKTVDAAEAKLAEAFSLKQKLDDEIPDTPAQRRAWHIEIIGLCQAANDLLDENVEAFEELRKLEQNAPEALGRLRTQRAALEAKIAAAPQALAALAAIFAPGALSTVTDNPDQASSRLALADRALTDAEQHLASDQAGQAAFAIRAGEEAVHQAAQLVEAIDTLGVDLAAIEEQARALIADLENDLAVAATLPAGTGQLATITASTRTRIDQARTQLAATGRDPQKVLAALDAANTEIDTTIAQVRDAVEQDRRRRQQLEQNLLQAQTQIRAAGDYIATRRGAVGVSPRTRLAEAEASLSQALSLQAANPEQSLQYAIRAYELARQAVSSAENEIQSFSHHNSGGSLGSDILGGILGGIISSAISGGGRSGGSSWSSSSSSWSIGGGSSRGGSSGGGFSPSSFGGARSRSGGGRF